MYGMRNRPFLSSAFFLFSDYSFILRSLRKIVQEGRKGKKKSACSQVHDDYITYELSNLKPFSFLEGKKKRKQSRSQVAHLSILDVQNWMRPSCVNILARLLSPFLSKTTARLPHPHFTLSYPVPCECNKVSTEENRKRRGKKGSRPMIEG